ncbi:unnamed protein product, partial [Symbiodinium natans]
ECPRLLELLQEGAMAYQKGFINLARPPRVTIRFIRTIEPAYPLRELLTAARQ